MSAGEAGTGVQLPSGCAPISLGRFAQVTDVFSHAASNPWPNAQVVVTCIDITATGAEPVQCFASVQGVIGEAFYYDSQSTGEGLGVRFTWRGQYALDIGERVQLLCTSSAPIDWGAHVDGYTILGWATPTH